MTREEWNEEFWGHYKDLRHRHPTWRIEECRKRAYAMTESLRGPRPSGLKAQMLDFAWTILKARNMDFDWTKNLWKGVRGAALGAVMVATLTFLEAFDTADEVTAMGVPLWAAKGIVILVSAGLPMLRNYWKMHRATD